MFPYPAPRAHSLKSNPFMCGVLCSDRILLQEILEFDGKRESAEIQRVDDEDKL